jgi:hypothetical protein
MALDTIIIDGDQVIFQPLMGAAIVVVKPGKMIASGKTTIKGVPVCVSGDEKNVEVPGCSYMTSVHTDPGTGTLKIKALAGDQLAAQSNSGNKAMILKGSQFEAVFEVETPAEDIKPVASGGAPIPDTTPSYAGKGQLIPANQKIKAT